MTPRQIRIVGVVVLVAGLLAAAIGYNVAPVEETGGTLGVDIRTNRDRLQLQRMGGSSYIMLKDFDDWFASLWHGRRLACTIGVLASVTFLLCRGVAHVHENMPPPEAGDRAPKRPTADRRGRE